jgi:hypothetical protein
MKFKSLCFVHLELGSGFSRLECGVLRNSAPQAIPYPGSPESFAASHDIRARSDEYRHAGGDHRTRAN